MRLSDCVKATLDGRWVIPSEMGGLPGNCPNPRAVSDREGHSQSKPGGSGGSEAGTFETDNQTDGNMASGKPLPRVREITHRGSPQIHRQILGGSHRIPRRRPSRAGFQHRRTNNPADCSQSKECSLCRPRCRSSKLGHAGVAHRDM